MCISVLIPIYNTNCDYFNQCLESIQHQTFKEVIEIIIINDGSSPDISTKIDNLVQEYNKNSDNHEYILFSLDKNHGIQHALNVGLEKCSYELIARMDADDIMKPKRLELQYNHMIANPSIHILGGQCEMMDEHTKKIKYKTKHPYEISKKYLQSNINTHWFVNHPTVMFKKSIIMEVGGYKETLRGHAEDVHLWLKLIKKGYHIFNVQEVVLTYRDCLTSLSHNFKCDVNNDIRRWILEL